MILAIVSGVVSIASAVINYYQAKEQNATAEEIAKIQAKASKIEASNKVLLEAIKLKEEQLKADLAAQQKQGRITTIVLIGAFGFMLILTNWALKDK